MSGIGYSPPLVDKIWVYGDPIIIYPKPYSIYLGGLIGRGRFAAWGQVRALGQRVIVQVQFALGNG